MKIPLRLFARSHAPTRRVVVLLSYPLSSFIFPSLCHLKIGENTIGEMAFARPRRPRRCRCRRRGRLSIRGGGQTINLHCSRGHEGAEIAQYFLFIISLIADAHPRTSVADNYGPIAYIFLAAWERRGIILPCG